MLQTLVTTSILATFVLPQAAPPSKSQDDARHIGVEATAKAYLEAIQAQDWHSMHGFLSDDSLYQDFTMEYFDREPIELVGADGIVDFWRTSSEDSGTSSIRFETRKSFVAGPVYVADVWTSVRVSGAYWGVTEDDIELSATQIIFLRIVEGKVLHHVDHVDYGAALEPIERAKKAAPPIDE